MAIIKNLAFFYIRTNISFIKTRELVQRTQTVWFDPPPPPPFDRTLLAKYKNNHHVIFQMNKQTI
jgi:hypothetical protein